MTEATAAARQQLAADLKAVITDSEELLRATAGAAGDRITAARARAEQTLRAAREKISGLEVVDQAKDMARNTDDYVHEHPWGAVGLAALAGVMIGVLIARR